MQFNLELSLEASRPTSGATVHAALRLHRLSALSAAPHTTAGHTASPLLHRTRAPWSSATRTSPRTAHACAPRCCRSTATASRARRSCSASEASPRRSWERWPWSAYSRRPPPRSPHSGPTPRSAALLSATLAAHQRRPRSPRAGTLRRALPRRRARSAAAPSGLLTRGHHLAWCHAPIYQIRGARHAPPPLV